MSSKRNTPDVSEQDRNQAADEKEFQARSIKSKEDLIQEGDGPINPPYELQSKDVHELHKIADEKNISHKGMSKEELISAILSSRESK